MEFAKNILKERLQVLEHAYKEYVVSGSVKPDSFSAVDNRNKVKDLEIALNTLEASESNLSLGYVSESEDLLREPLLKFLNWYVKDEALRDKPDRLTNIVDRYLKGF